MSNFKKFGEELNSKRQVEHGSQLYQEVALEYAMSENLYYVAGKCGIDVKELEFLLTKKEFQKQLERAKEEIQKTGKDAFNFRLALLRMRALDEIEAMAFGPESRDKLNALKALLQMSGDLTTVKTDKEENKVKEKQVVVNIKRESKE